MTHLGIERVQLGPAIDEGTLLILRHNGEIDLGTAPAHEGETFRHAHAVENAELVSGEDQGQNFRL